MSIVINTASIQSKVDGAATSKYSGAKLQEILNMIRRGVALPGVAVSGQILTLDQIAEFGDKLKDLIILNGSSLPKSIKWYLDSISVSSPKMIDQNHFEITLSLPGYMQRPSLNVWAYGFVDNIIALFNNGYYAERVVFGYWPGHGMTSSLTERPGLHFMNKAVDEFNGMYGETAKAELSGKYI